MEELTRYYLAMETFFVLAAIAAAHLIAVASPGPSLVVVVQTAISDSRGAAVLNAFGFGVGTLIWAVAALFGLATLFEIAPWLYLLVKTAGACFLLFLAYRIWMGAGTPFPTGSLHKTRERGPGENYLLGLVTQLSNPKVAIFFGSIFVTLVPRDASPGLLAAVVGLVFAIETLWYLTMAYAFSTPGVRERYVAYKASVDRASASFLGLLGIGLLLDRR